MVVIGRGEGPWLVEESQLQSRDVPSPVKCLVFRCFTVKGPTKALSHLQKAILHSQADGGGIHPVSDATV
jgi:hypothetical protein